MKMMRRIVFALGSLCMGLMAGAPSHLIGPQAHAQTVPAANEVDVVAGAPLGGFNRLMVTVTVCKPGTTTCHQIPNVMVDTGSTGLRLQAGFATGLGLAPVLTAGNKPLAQCLDFGKSAFWGGLWKADVRIGGMTAKNIAIQVAAYDNDTTLPRGSCPPSRASANGTLGIGWRKVDPSGGLYTCSGGSCQAVTCSDPGCHLPNPVSKFPSDNNGEVFSLPPAAGEWIRAVNGGKMIFGVNTRSNNQIGTAAQYVPLSDRGRFTTHFDHQSYDDSYIDSGTMYNGFHDDTMVVTSLCKNNSSYYCLKAGTTLTASFSSQRAGAGPEAIAQTSFAVSSPPGPVKQVTLVHDLLAYANPVSGQFVWGLPFFFNKQVFLVQETETPSTVPLTGPFYAYAPYVPQIASAP